MSKAHHEVAAYVQRMTSTGRLLTRARARMGLSQDDVAERLGRKRGNVLHMETGRRGIPGHQVLSVARAYGCDPVAILRALERDRKGREE